MHAPHPLHGTMLAGSVGRLYTCDDCGVEFAGTHKQAIVDSEVTARYCRTCKPVGYDVDTTPADLRAMSDDAVARKWLKPPASDVHRKTYGRSVFDPRWGDGEPRYPDEYDAHAQAEVRARMRERQRGRF